MDQPLNPYSRPFAGDAGWRPEYQPRHYGYVRETFTSTGYGPPPLPYYSEASPRRSGPPLPMDPYPIRPALPNYPHYASSSGPASTYQPDYHQQRPVSYHNSNIPPEAQLNLPWHIRKAHLSRRFKLDRSSVDIENEHKPEGSHLSDSQSDYPGALVRGQKVSMISFVKWIGDHAREYRGRAKVTDLAGRFCHNLRDFTALFSQQIPRSRHDPAHESLYRQGLEVQDIFETTIAVYRGPFVQKWGCSADEWSKSRELFEFMFDHDYDKLEGLLWHVVNWIRECHQSH
ncbi:hypothetical protein F5Y14DRAFT_448091 [Nemania sp. NC0429]|nr:hypothetical protein F5Y14DRAFT_448091 [Nemania sp. NC0429]